MGDRSAAHVASSGARIAGLDGLRAVAILLVILWHAIADRPYRASELGLLRDVAALGWTGVDLFFALSGFLITRLILCEEDAAARRGLPRAFNVGHFYLRRALRILPPFYVVFAASLLLARWEDFRSVAPARALLSERPLALLPYATFWGNYDEQWVHPGAHPGAGFTVYWSLCVEEHFYLLWPTVLTVVRSRALRLLVGASVCAALLCARALAHLQATEGGMAIHMLSHYRLDSILWGALAAFGYEGLVARPRWRAALLTASLVVVLTLVLRGDLASPASNTWVGASLGFSALAASSAALVVHVAASPGAALTRALESRPLRAIGRASYGMYLVHFQVLDLLRPLLAALRGAPRLHLLTTFALVSLATLAVATLLYVALERPMMRLKVRMGWERPRGDAR